MYCHTVTFDSPAHLISYTLNFYSGIIHVSDFNIYQTNTSTRHPYFYLSMTFGNMKNSNLQLEKVLWNAAQTQSSLRGKSIFNLIRSCCLTSDDDGSTSRFPPQFRLYVQKAASFNHVNIR